MGLTELQVRKAAAREKDYKLADAGGLYLFVMASGGKSWRFKYRFAGREKRLVFGRYPETPLAEARAARDEARRLLRENRDPAIEKRKRRIVAHVAAENTFGVVARRWHADQTARWSPLQATKVRQAFERDVYPQIGPIPLVEIDPQLVLQTLRKVENRGAIDTAKRIRQHISAVFAFGIAEGICDVDPAASVGRALKPSPKGRRQPAVRSLDEARTLLTVMEASTSSPVTKLASRLLAITVVRPGVVRAATWDEFENVDWSRPDLPSPSAVWRISAERIKLALEDKGDEAYEHVVPLSDEAVLVLHAIRRLSGRIRFLFPGVRSTRAPMSENTIGYMYARNGYSGRHVPHGWRATFSTIMNERAIAERRPDDRAIIDAMLAHRPKGLSGSEMAYNRALHMPRRRELAQIWASLICEGLADPAELLRGQVR